MRKFGSDGGIDDALIEFLEESILTKYDYINDKSWYFAPICVCTNAEINSFTPLIAEAFAREHNTPMITWNIPLSHKTYDITNITIQPLV